MTTVYLKIITQQLFLNKNVNLIQRGPMTQPAPWPNLKQSSDFFIKDKSHVSSYVKIANI
jgi:hypothetical protein